MENPPRERGVKMGKFMWGLMLIGLLLGQQVQSVEKPMIKATQFPEGGMLAVRPAPSIGIDFSGFPLDKGQGGPAGRSDRIAVQIQHNGRSDYYSLPFTSKRQLYVLSAASLTPHSSLPFPGFRKGAVVYLLLGTEPFAGALDKGMFKEQWTLILRVEEGRP